VSTLQLLYQFQTVLGSGLVGLKVWVVVPGKVLPRQKVLLSLDSRLPL